MGGGLRIFPKEKYTPEKGLGCSVRMDKYAFYLNLLMIPKDCITGGVMNVWCDKILVLRKLELWVLFIRSLRQNRFVKIYICFKESNQIKSNLKNILKVFLWTSSNE